MKTFVIQITRFFYRVFRPVLFLTDCEVIHGRLTRFGENAGKGKMIKSFFRVFFEVKNPSLEQIIHGIEFKNPVGLAAGFDYEARLTQILPAVGFGFGTVGTITNRLYEGNPLPRLGRLVKSRSLLVNKGFKNLGIDATLKKLEDIRFENPVGLSIGKTNSREEMTQESAIEDILLSFRAAEASSVHFSYYELNISCPNLFGNVEFYSPKHLDELLRKVSALNLKKPLFIKMPIEKSDEETKAMLETITKHPVQGVIFGNLQKNRQDPSLDQEEVKKYDRGYFSGKPTQKRSDELIALAYKNFGSKLTIIGCGGIFSAEDAYRKIKLGASLIQLITGMIYVGPQLAGQVNAGLVKLLQKDGFSNISEAVGKNVF